MGYRKSSQENIKMSTCIIGDLHGIKKDLRYLLTILPFGPANIICAGDVGLEYGNPHMVQRFRKNTKYLKQHMKDSNYNWFIMRGNHDNRYFRDHYNSELYVVDEEQFGAPVLYEKEYPNIYYIKDEGGIYRIDNKEFLFIPGAYSVDKDYRLENGLSWNPSEQLTVKEQNDLLDLLEQHNNKVDYIVSHTYPLNIQNRVQDLFLEFIDQSHVDRNMEKFLAYIAEIVDFKHWFFGHLHDDREIMSKYTMLFNKVANLKEYEGEK